MIFFPLYAELFMICCGDGKLDPGPEMCYEYYFKGSEKYKNNSRFVHLKSQDVSKNHMQLKPFINDMGINTIFSISEICDNPNDKVSSGNVAPKTQKPFRLDRSPADCKKPNRETQASAESDVQGHELLAVP